MNVKKTDEKCDLIMNEYLALDKNQKLPLAVTLHLLSCEKCRTEVRLLSMAEKMAARRLPTGAKVKSGLENPVSLKNWVTGGIIMTVFLLCFLIFSATLQNQALTLAFALVFAFMVTAYCALFVGVNLDFFVKKMESYESRRTVN